MTLIADDLECSDWPREINGVLVEPGIGVLRVRRRGRESIELDLPAARELASAADHPVRKQCLLDALTEAQRQEEAFLGLPQSSPPPPPPTPPEVTHCRRGHPFTPENTGHRADGKRWCRTCNKACNRRHSNTSPPAAGSSSDAAGGEDF